MSEHLKGQIVRAVRLLAAVLASQPVASAIASSTLIRYPLAAALVAGFEVAVRQGFPVKALPRISSVLAPAAAPSPLPTITSDTAATVRVVAPPPLPPMTPVEVPLNPDGTGTASNPAPTAPPGGEGTVSP